MGGQKTQASILLKNLSVLDSSMRRTVEWKLVLKLRSALADFIPGSLVFRVFIFRFSNFRPNSGALPRPFSRSASARPFSGRPTTTTAGAQRWPAGCAPRRSAKSKPPVGNQERQRDPPPALERHRGNPPATILRVFPSGEPVEYRVGRAPAHIRARKLRSLFPCS